MNSLFATSKRPVARCSSRFAGVSRSTFDADGEKQDRIMRQMEIIGEATSNPSEQFRWAYLRMDWRGMKDLRDVLLYGYAKVDLDEDWNIA